MIPIALSAFCFLTNIPLGYWRKRVKKFSPSWFIAVHAAVPIIIAIRVFFGVSSWFIPLFVVFAAAGQLVGGRITPFARAPR
ncbi:MAG: hypothetical protein LBD73_06550 [Deferribacteraceae bacterium]|jgi:hypothetical protein|nr:hypothetical protein [Deferribacteraceae bacterium]